MKTNPIHFEAGETYWSEMYEGEYKCLRRWFDGLLELVELQHVGPAGCCLPFIRTARAMQPGFNVRETRGGVTDPRFCKHDRGFITTETYGVICPLCGTEKKDGE